MKKIYKNTICILMFLVMISTLLSCGEKHGLTKDEQRAVAPVLDTLNVVGDDLKLSGPVLIVYGPAKDGTEIYYVFVEYENGDKSNGFNGGTVRMYNREEYVVDYLGEEQAKITSSDIMNAFEQGSASFDKFNLADCYYRYTKGVLSQRESEVHNFIKVDASKVAYYIQEEYGKTINY